MDENIPLSLKLIKERIKRISTLLKESEELKKIGKEKLLNEGLRLNLIEIGEESKLLNDFLLEKKEIGMMI
jgi:hypothetical protein